MLFDTKVFSGHWAVHCFVIVLKKKPEAHVEHYIIEIFDDDGEHFVQFAGHLTHCFNKLIVVS